MAICGRTSHLASMKLDKYGYLRRAPRLLGGLRRKNVRESERWVSLLAGLGLAALGLRRWKARAVALGAASMLMRRGLTGSCPLYKKLGLRSA